MIKLKGECEVPADKSIVHRAILFNALAKGASLVRAGIVGRDNLATARIVKQLGVDISLRVPASKKSLVEGEQLDDVIEFDDFITDFQISIKAEGRNSLSAPTAPLYCGNSGTSARLLSGVLAGCDFESTIEGDSSLSGRPFKRVSVPLGQMGAGFESLNEKGDGLPLVIKGGSLKAISYESPVASAQVKSAVLLAGLFAEGKTAVSEPTLSRDHTENLLTAMGCEFEKSVAEDGSFSVSFKNIPEELEAVSLEVPGDFSQAAFVLVAASLVAESEVLVKNLCFNPTRNGIFHVLKRMGADLEVQNQRVLGGEQVVDVLVRPSKLKGTTVDEKEIVSLIDEVPILAVAAAYAEGETLINGVSELRVKESDRVAMIEDLLWDKGHAASSEQGSITVHGKGSSSEHKSAQKWSICSDHRILMCGVILELIEKGELNSYRPEIIETSFPNFYQLFQDLSAS